MISCLLIVLFCVSPKITCTIPADRMETAADIIAAGGAAGHVLLAAAESKLNARAVSPVGAYGTFQITEIAERHVNSTRGLQLDRHKPQDNIHIGLLYWNELFQKYNHDYKRTLVAYNWGPTAADKWDGNMESLPLETQQLIKRFEEYGMCLMPQNQ